MLIIFFAIALFFCCLKSLLLYFFQLYQARTDYKNTLYIYTTFFLFFCLLNYHEHKKYLIKTSSKSCLVSLLTQTFDIYGQYMSYNSNNGPIIFLKKEKILPVKQQY